MVHWSKSEKREETLKKMSLAKKGKYVPWNYRKKLIPLSIEQREKISSSLKGRKISDETRKKMSLANINSIAGFKNGHIPWIKGKNMSEEQKRKLSATRIKLFNEGKITAWNKGLPSPWTTKRNLTENNPAKSEEVRKKISLKKRGIPSWNKGLPSPWTTKRNLTENNPAKSEKNRERQRQLRAKQIFPLKDSKPEIKIQEFLRQLNIEFVSHKLMPIEHKYQCDIYIPTINLVIECDGDYWHGNPKKFSALNKNQQKLADKDKIRTEELINRGFKILRFWESDIIKMNIEEFNNQIKKV